MKLKLPRFRFAMTLSRCLRKPSIQYAVYSSNPMQLIFRLVGRVNLVFLLVV